MPTTTAIRRHPRTSLHSWAVTIAWARLGLPITDPFQTRGYGHLPPELPPDPAEGEQFVDWGVPLGNRPCRARRTAGARTARRTPPVSVPAAPAIAATHIDRPKLRKCIAVRKRNGAASATAPAGAAVRSAAAIEAAGPAHHEPAFPAPATVASIGAHGRDHADRCQGDRPRVNDDIATGSAAPSRDAGCAWPSREVIGTRRLPARANSQCICTAYTWLTRPPGIAAIRVQRSIDDIELIGCDGNFPPVPAAPRQTRFAAHRALLRDLKIRDYVCADRAEGAD